MKGSRMKQQRNKMTAKKIAASLGCFGRREF